MFVVYVKCRGSLVVIAASCEVNNRGVVIRVPVGSRISLLHIMQTGSGAHPVFHPIGTGGDFPEGKAAGV
jgi:hypothetical protein